MPNGTTGGGGAAKHAELAKIEIDGQKFYIAEGDLLLDEDQLEEYAHRQAGLEEREDPAGR